MNVDITEFKRFLKKATINFNIDNVQIVMEDKRMKSKMISSHSDAISVVDVENVVFPGVTKNDNITLNFSEPNASLMPYLNLLDESEDAEIKLFDEKITLIQGKQKSNIFFCSPHVIHAFNGDLPKNDIESFVTIPINDDFTNAFSKIKKIGSKFSKVYFGVDSNVLYIETSDKQNRFSNGLRIDILDLKYDDMNICFDFKNLNDIMSILDNDTFNIDIKYIETQNLGMVSIKSTDDTEKYYLLSHRD